MTEDAGANADQLAYWNDTAGKTWVELQDELDCQLEPLGRRAMDALAPQPGERLLDLGCGTGQTTLALAKRVGAGGSVLGVDISRPMLEIARRRAAGLSHVSFREADAQIEAFAPGALDAVYSRFGVMFFADPPAAFANIRKGLKPGGRLAFICWRPLAENPWMTPSLGAAAAQLALPAPLPPGAPGPFAFADAERVRDILSGVGFGDVMIAPHDADIGGNSLDDTVKLSLRVGPVGALLREHPEARDQVAGEIRQHFAGRLRDGRVWQGSATWIVTARRP